MLGLQVPAQQWQRIRHWPRFGQFVRHGLAQLACRDVRTPAPPGRCPPGCRLGPFVTFGLGDEFEQIVSGPLAVLGLGRRKLLDRNFPRKRDLYRWRFVGDDERLPQPFLVVLQASYAVTVNALDNPRRAPRPRRQKYVGQEDGQHISARHFPAWQRRVPSCPFVSFVDPVWFPTRLLDRAGECSYTVRCDWQYFWSKVVFVNETRERTQSRQWHRTPTARF